MEKCETFCSALGVQESNEWFRCCLKWFWRNSFDLPKKKTWTCLLSRKFKPFLGCIQSMCFFQIRPMWGFRQLKLKRPTTTSGMDTFIACATEWLSKWQILYPYRFLVVEFFPTCHNEAQTLVSLSIEYICIHKQLLVSKPHLDSSQRNTQKG